MTIDLAAAATNGKAAQLAGARESAYMGPFAEQKGLMTGFFEGLTGVIIVAVAVVLVLGVINMMRGTSPNRSQTLMRWRVLLQFAAIIVMMTALYLSQRH